MRDYFYVRDEAKKRHDAGLSALEVALDIDMTDYDSWGDGERIVVNVATLYKEFNGDSTPNDAATLFGQMTEVAKKKGILKT